MSRRLPLLALFTADAISVTGNVLSLVAIPWFVLELTGSPALTGLVAFFTATAAVIASFFGGTLVDRVGFRRMSVIADIASAVSVAAIPVLKLAFGIEIWELVVLVFVGALLDAPGTAARTSMLPDLAEISGTPLERATSISNAVRRGAILVGAPIGGALILVVGTQGVLVLDAISFLVSAALIGFLTPAIAYHEHAEPEGLTAADSSLGLAGEEAVAPTATEVPARGRFIDDLLDGLRFIWRDHLARAIVLTIMFTNFLDAPLISVVMPVYVHDVYGSSVELGLLLGVFGGAALLGAIGYGIVGPRLPRRLTFGVAFVIVGLPFWVLALQPPFPVALICFAITGLAAGPINPIISTVMFERVPRAMRGRVTGAMTSGAFVAMPVGMLMAGIVAERYGVIAAIVGVAAAYLLVTVSILLNPAMREMDRPGPVAASA